jgi:hypothetical protein
MKTTKDSDWYKALLLLTLMAIFDLDPTGQEGVSAERVQLANAAWGANARDWTVLMSMITAGDQPLCRQKGRTLYILEAGRTMARKVSEHRSSCEVKPA